MIGHLVKRIFAAIPTLFGVTLIVFLLFNWVGGDPVYTMLGGHASAKQIEEVRRQYGFDLPLHSQYLNYLKRLIAFDFGVSYSAKQPIRNMILKGITPSLSLMIPSFIGSHLLAIAIGLMTAFYRGRIIDRLSTALSIIGMSIPILAYILFGQYFLGFKLGLFPISGYDPRWPEGIYHLLLPMTIFIAVTAGANVRFYRTIILDEASQDYVRTARAKGLSEWNVYTHHILRNCLVPVLTYVLGEIPSVLLGTFLLESFFSIPGLGSMTIDAVNNSDMPVIQAMTVFVAILYISANLLTDILYVWVDPRIDLGS